MRFRPFRALFALPLLLTATAANAADLLVFAAASLQPALDEVIATPVVKAIGTIMPSYGASSALARQIEAGAPADLFISADNDWMDYLAERKRIAADSRFELVHNDLVLVAPAASRGGPTIMRGFDLRSALGDGRLALAEPNTVPAGKYAKASLTTLGVWESIADRTVSTESVRAALALVVRAEAPYGVVYLSDAVSEPKVRIIGAFPADSHPEIEYPAAIIRGRDNIAARAFATLLQSPTAQRIFARHGFVTSDAEEEKRELAGKNEVGETR